VRFPEQFRWKDAPAGYATHGGEPFGAFIVPAHHAPGLRILKIIAVDGDADTQWDHVSVSLAEHPNKIPSWDEMCFVKSLFWDDEEWVMQFHPAKSEYVNRHPGVLHLWRYCGAFPFPRKEFVG
jgi:hypothetical protein